jgi:hypothetical protein
MAMRKGDVLAWGMQHIASNHKVDASIEYEEDGSMCIYGDCNVPILNDVQMLCEDLGIPRDHVEPCDFGVDVYIDWDWTQEGGLLQQDYVPTGMELWKRHGAVIGE